MSDGSMDAHRLGDLGRCPFGLVDVEVKEDPTSRRILQRGDGSVDLGEWFITHAGSLSTGASAARLGLQSRRISERPDTANEWAMAPESILRVPVSDGPGVRLDEVTRTVAPLGHDVIARVSSLLDVARITAAERPDVALVIVHEASTKPCS
jgi:hypothetical protein